MPLQKELANNKPAMATSEISWALKQAQEQEKGVTLEKIDINVNFPTPTAVIKLTPGFMFNNGVLSGNFEKNNQIFCIPFTQIRWVEITQL